MALPGVVVPVAAPTDTGWADTDDLLEYLATVKGYPQVTRDQANVANLVASMMLFQLADERVRPLVEATWVTISNIIGYGVPLGPQGRVVGSAVDLIGGSLFSGGAFDAATGRVALDGTLLGSQALALPTVSGTVQTVELSDGKTWQPLTVEAWSQEPGSPVLKRIDGGTWPRTDIPTSSIRLTMTHGGVDTAASNAAKALAAELALIIAPIKLKPGDSLLGPRMVQLGRQGITQGFADMSTIARDGWTGVPLTDLWLAGLRRTGGDGRVSIPRDTSWAKVGPARPVTSLPAGTVVGDITLASLSAQITALKETVVSFQQTIATNPTQQIASNRVKKTAAYTLVSGDYVEAVVTAATSFVLPALVAGQVFGIDNATAFPVTLTITGGGTFTNAAGATTASLVLPANQYTAYDLATASDASTVYVR